MIPHVPDVIDITNAHTHTLWMGDLNYRVDMLRQDVDKILLSGGNFEQLLVHD